MPNAREWRDQSIPVPPPVAIESVRERWDDVPELACAAAWSEACAAWWTNRDDERLLRSTLESLLLDDAELTGWLGRSFDNASLIAAHGHVTAMRAGVERDLSGRTLTTGAFRTHDVWTDHQSGTRRVFPAAQDVPALLERAYAEHARLPEHPIIRAAWMSHILGAIHPFRDANGGTARFFASLELARWSLPPLTLSAAQRNGAYVEGLVAGDLDVLAFVVHDSVQTGLANALLANHGHRADWHEASLRRGQLWASIVEECWRAATGGTFAVEQDTAQCDTVLPRFVRVGNRVPAAPTPRCASWRVASPLPARFDLAIVPLRGGTTTWLGAVVAASIGERGQLAAVLDHEHVETMFVAPDSEPDEIVEARFRRWIALRVDQSVRGLARWM